MKMTGNKFILDTNIVVALLDGDHDIADKIDNAGEIYIPAIVLGELFYGAAFSARKEKNKKKIDVLIKEYLVLHVDEKVSESYGTIKSELRKKGKPIPENDIWIAAIALTHDIPLVSKDKHFKESKWNFSQALVSHIKSSQKRGFHRAFLLPGKYFC